MEEEHIDRFSVCDFDDSQDVRPKYSGDPFSKTWITQVWP